MSDAWPAPDRRFFLALCAALGIDSAALAGARRGPIPTSDAPPDPRAARSDPPEITKEMIAAAEGILGLAFDDAERTLLADDLREARERLDAVRGIPLDNSVAPVLSFDPEVPGLASVARPRKEAPAAAPPPPPAPAPVEGDDLAFLGISELASLLSRREVRAGDLAARAIARLREADPTLHCVVTLTEERALAQARRADVALAAGRPAGPLHGIPWGAKDLFAVPSAPTTWGSPVYREQALMETATAVERLDREGSVLVAKLALGELAMGDVWFGGRTRNPWKPTQGSSGSSAGPAAAVAAGLVPFALGTETLGSIVSPCVRCGVTGLRPTFGRVSRHGAMALAWSMDKVGPIARSAVDCGLVFAAIHGADGRDPTARDRPFAWSPGRSLAGIRIAYAAGAFEGEGSTAAADRAFLDVLRQAGAAPVAERVAFDVPVAPLRLILVAEAAAAFDALTRSGDDARMVRQGRGTWPAVFRAARFIPAVEYLNANRARTRLAHAMDALFSGIDVLVSPPYAGDLLLASNLTGHPALVLPHGFATDGAPMGITLVGRLFGEADLLTVGEAFQRATDFHRRRPPR